MTKLSLLFFSANDGVSDLQREIIKELQSVFQMMIDFKEIDVTKYEELKKEYNIKSTPTIVIECRGKEKERFLGLTQELFLRRAIRKISKKCR